MKQKLLSALLMSAFAGLATTASAGVIQASYKNFAAEAFGADVALTAPTIGYALAQPLTGTAANPNSFTITWTLTTGEWATAPTATLVGANNVDFIAANPTIDATDKRILKASFTLNSGVTFPVGSTIVLGSNGVNVAALDGTVAKTYTTLRVPADDACNPTTAQVGVEVKMTNAAGVEFESNFQNFSNKTPILQSGVALRAKLIASSAFVTKETSQVNVLNPALGKTFTNTGDVTLAATDRINLGQLTLQALNSLYDTNGAAFYSPVTNGATLGATTVAGDGKVSQGGVSVKVSGKFATDGLLTLKVADDCTGAALNAAASTFNAGFTEGTVALTAAEYSAVAVTGGVATLNICYNTAGGKVIPVSQFSVLAGSSVIAKAAASNEIATPVCAGNLYNLTANGVVVDVRNYIPAIVEAPSGGWKNVIRIINTDETQPSVDVVGTALLRNGDLGATAVIAAGMKPREVRYLSGASIDALLTAAATATAKTFGADDIAANARLRITAPSSSIRVQNYHFNPATGNYLEASAAQGDDGVVNVAAPTIADVIRARADGQNK